MKFIDGIMSGREMPRGSGIALAYSNAGIVVPKCADDALHAARANTAR